MPGGLIPLATLLSRPFCNPDVAGLPRTVDTFAGPLESRLNIPGSVRRLMSRNNSVRKEIATTIYLDPQMRPNFAPLIR